MFEEETRLKDKPNIDKDYDDSITLLFTKQIEEYEFNENSDKIGDDHDQKIKDIKDIDNMMIHISEEECQSNILELKSKSYQTLDISLNRKENKQ